jgi:DNA polymerase III subunit delta'
MALLLRFEEANPSASNALLKTLEEPSPHVVLVLTAVSPESLLPTIVSRCEVLRLAPAPLEKVRQYLQIQKGLPAEKATLLAHLAAGRVGYAFKLQDDPQRLVQRQAWLDDLHHLLSSRRVERFSYAESLSKDKDQARQVLQLWLSYWRDVMLRTVGASAPVNNWDRVDEIEDLSGRMDTLLASETVKALERTIAQLENNVNPRVALEVLLLDLPGLPY